MVHFSNVVQEQKHCAIGKLNQFQLTSSVREKKIGSSGRWQPSPTRQIRNIQHKSSFFLLAMYAVYTRAVEYTHTHTIPLHPIVIYEWFSADASRSQHPRKWGYLGSTTSFRCCCVFIYLPVVCSHLQCVFAQCVCVCVCDMKLYSIYMDAQDIGEPAKRKRNTHTQHFECRD